MRPLLPRSAAGRLGLALTITLATAGTAGLQAASVGLSALRAQRFGNEDLAGFNPNSFDGFARALAVGDFNGDGVDDLATGIPGSDGLASNPVANCGAVVVRFGVFGSGLDTAPVETVLGQFTANSPDPAETGDVFGHALAACDFDADGHDDLAVGIPGETVNNQNAAGAIQVYYGSSAGLVGAPVYYDENTPGIPGAAFFEDYFGWALACGDFDQDGFDDLAIGIPRKDFANGGDAGMVDVIPGGAGGLQPTAAVAFHQDTPNMQDFVEANDFFGRALATGDFNGDGYDDLAVGVPFEEDVPFEDMGAVQVVYGSASGLTATGNDLFVEASFGVSNGLGDQFGDALAAGDFNGDGYDDLAAGAPLRDTGGSASSGMVIEAFGSAAGIAIAGAEAWDENRIFFPGASEENDRFGYALVAGDFDRDGHDDLAIGHPAEFLVGPSDGAVAVIMGSEGAGLDPVPDRHRSIGEGLAGFPGDPTQHGEFFGGALASGDFDGDGHADLAIGAPYEDENGLTDVGAVVVLYGSIFADGFETATTGEWSAAVP